MLTLTVALWLGGLVALFSFAQALFSADRALAVRAAPVLFDVFAPYQLILAGVGLVAGGAWWGATRRRSAAGAVGLLAVAAAGAAVVGFLIVPRMEAIRLAGESGSDAFKQLHGASMAVFLGETLALFAAAVILAVAGKCRADAPPASG